MQPPPRHSSLVARTGRPRFHEPGPLGFSLVELLIVMAIIGLLAVVMAPALNFLQRSGALTKASSDIDGILEQARSHAMAKNTYVYVGLQEVDALTPTVNNGIGRIAVAVIASADGLRPYGDIPAPLSTNIQPVSRLFYFDNVHLTNAETLINGTNMTGRPKATDLSQVTAATTFLWPIGAATPKYNFQKVIEIDPQGSARIQTNTSFDPSVVNEIEIALVPAQGNATSTNIANQAAIQINGVSGKVRIYRP